jgi:hypothetical protein
MNKPYSIKNISDSSINIDGNIIQSNSEFIVWKNHNIFDTQDMTDNMSNLEFYDRQGVLIPEKWEAKNQITNSGDFLPTEPTKIINDIEFEKAEVHEVLEFDSFNDRASSERALSHFARALPNKEKFEIAKLYSRIEENEEDNLETTFRLKISSFWEGEEQTYTFVFNPNGNVNANGFYGNAINTEISYCKNSYKSAIYSDNSFSASKTEDSNNICDFMEYAPESSGLELTLPSGGLNTSTKILNKSEVYSLDVICGSVTQTISPKKFDEFLRISGNWYCKN